MGRLGIVYILIALCMSLAGHIRPTPSSGVHVPEVVCVWTNASCGHLDINDTAEIAANACTCPSKITCDDKQKASGKALRQAAGWGGYMSTGLCRVKPVSVACHSPGGHSLSKLCRLNI